jgi:hypothetical protein
MRAGGGFRGKAPPFDIVLTKGKCLELRNSTPAVAQLEQRKSSNERNFLVSPLSQLYAR